MLAEININELSFPIIVKPNICSRVSKDVYVIKNLIEINKYIKQNNNKLNEIIYQEYIPFKNEVGVLYERDFFGNNGKIVSIIKKSSQKYDIMKSCDGYDVKCKNLTDNISPEFNKIICDIANSIPNFNVGRFDIKYLDEKSLFEGKNFYILEANGTMGFDLRKDTSNFFMSNYYLNRWFWYRFLYGLKNIVMLEGYGIIDNFNILIESINNYIKCDDWEKLFCRYP